MLNQITVVSSNSDVAHIVVKDITKIVTSDILVRERSPLDMAIRNPITSYSKEWLSAFISEEQYYYQRVIALLISEENADFLDRMFKCFYELLHPDGERLPEIFVVRLTAKSYFPELSENLMKHLNNVQIHKITSEYIPISWPVEFVPVVKLMR